MDQILLVRKQWIMVKNQKCHCSFRQNLGRECLLTRSMGPHNNVWGSAFHSEHRVLRVAWTHIKNSKNGEETNKLFYEEERRNDDQSWAPTAIRKEWNQRAILILLDTDNICSHVTRVFDSWWAHRENHLSCWYYRGLEMGCCSPCNSKTLNSPP